jgi:hypothetical protein
MVNKDDLDKMLGKYRPMIDKFGKDMGEAAKKGEENVAKMSKVLKMQLDILGIAIQKERLYYEIGKEVAGMLTDGNVDVSKLEKHKKALEEMKNEDEKRKRAIARVSTSGSKTKKTVSK